MNKIWKTGVLSALFLVAGLLYGASAEEYSAYISQFEDAPLGENKIVLKAADYFETDMENITVLEDGTLYTPEAGTAAYRFLVPEAGLYQIKIRYFPGNGTGEMIRMLSVNGKVPFSQAESLTFSRMWNDKNRDYKQQKENQSFPSQVQQPEWRDAFCQDSQGYIASPFLFYFDEGENIIEWTSLSGSMILDTITLLAPEELPSYQEYLEYHLKNGVAYADTEVIKIQAEDTYLKSGPSFYPVNDRTSPLSEPYHPSFIVLNCIGDTAWNEPGEWLEWEMNAPEDGLYRLILRFKQSDLRGMYAARKLLIDGKIPFQEAADLRFYHDTDFQVQSLGNIKENEEYWFYLKKGSHRINLEVTLGELGDVLLKLEESASKLNSIYRSIISITGTNPDTLQSYRLFTRIPDLKDKLTESKENNTLLLEKLTDLMGSGNERTAALNRLVMMMDDLINNEEQLIKRLPAFKECITAIGKSVLDFKNQPMKIDYILLAGKELPQIRAEGNFGEKLKHTVLSFIGSFTNDYTVAGSSLSEDKKEIQVWLSTGRDQFEVIRRLINEDFEKETGIRVNLRLIHPDVLLPSTFTGNGPEVAIQLGNTAPVNFAFRGAALDLKIFEDYEETANQFLPAAMESFYYKDGCFALPDQMSFPVMFYRKDIFEELNLNIPESWEELLALIPELQRHKMEMYLDTAPPASMGAVLSVGNSVPINTIFLSRLYQTDGEIYDDAGTKCMLDSDEGNAAFKWWTQFYTQHGFLRDIDFVTRFRLGEVPLGIVDLTTFTRLQVSAPEIRGDWAVEQVPGTRQKDGSIRYAAPCVTGASMIIKSAVEKHQNQNEAWAFLKWWTGEQTQIKFAWEMEAILGQAGRYPVANMKAFDQINWDLHTKKVLENSLATLRGIPQVAGGYITGRYLNNAFITVITEYTNAADTLFEQVELINEEMNAKRKEFELYSVK